MVCACGIQHEYRNGTGITDGHIQREREREREREKERGHVLYELAVN